MAAWQIRGLKDVATHFGQLFSAEELHACETADCTLISSNGHRLKAHHDLIVDCTGKLNFPLKADQIHVPLSDTALQLFMDVVYVRKITAWDAALELLHFAEITESGYLLDELLMAAWKHIDIDGLVKYWLLSRDRMLACELGLRRRVADVLTEMASNIDGPAYTALMTSPSEALLDLLHDDAFHSSDAETTFKVISDWSIRNPEDAKANCIELFTAIRYSNPFERRECVNGFKDLFKSLNTDEDLLKEATSQWTSYKPRYPRSLFLLMGGWDQRGFKKTYFYDTACENWAPIPKLNLEDELSFFRVAFVDTKLYVIGGCTAGRFQTEVKKYDFETLKWSPAVTLNETKCLFTIATFNRQIYIMGGTDAELPIATAERLDCDSNTWETLPPLSVKRSDAASIEFNNRIWITGGYDGERTLDLVEAFDPANHTWHEMSRMLESRSGHCAVKFLDKIYVFGGYQHGERTNLVECYSAEAGHWTPAPPMLTPRCDFCAIVYEGCIWAMGGTNENGIIGECEKFDGHKWSQVQCLPKPIAGGATINVERPRCIGLLLGRDLC